VSDALARDTRAGARPPGLSLGSLACARRPDFSNVGRDVQAAPLKLEDRIEQLADAWMRRDHQAARRALPPSIPDELVLALEGAAPDEALSLFYESTLERGERRAHGVHYTSPDVADRVTSEALALWRGGPGPPRVIDPAMGSGVFLRATLRRLLALGHSAPTLARYLYGIDRDPLAVLVARRCLWLVVGDASASRAMFDESLTVGDAMWDPRALDEGGTAWSRLFAAAPTSFDVVLMNPPFLGGKRLRTVLGEDAARRLVAMHPGTNGNVDLAAHFLRRAFIHLSPAGVVGAVTTNTIAQGDTREGGLEVLLRQGGRIARAEKRVPWPGDAGVVTSLVWLVRGELTGAPVLDGAPVANIDSHLSQHDSRTRRFPTMRDRAFIGCFLRAKGFVFVDEDGAMARPLREALAARPQSVEHVRPFLGGEEIMKDPEHRPRRHVIDFGTLSLEDASLHPELLALLRQRVKPSRDALGSSSVDRAHRAAWWRFANPRPELRLHTRTLSEVLVIPRVSSQVVAVRVRNASVFSDQLVVVASQSAAVLALLVSRVHSAWAEHHASTLGDGLRYTPTDVFETLPIPTATFEELESHAELASAGERFEATRRKMLEELGVGLSTLIRRAAKEDPATAPYRRALVEVDEVVLRAYGWRESTPAWWAEGVRPRLDPALRARVLERLLAASRAA
jgi:hypothetical protein